MDKKHQQKTSVALGFENLNFKHEKFPGLSNITVQEAALWGRVCRDEGKTPAQVLEIISCVDDLLTIQRMAPMINKRRGNTVRRTKMKDVLIERIVQTDL